MTKEEFLSMVEEELNRVEKQLRVVSSKQSEQFYRPKKDYDKEGIDYESALLNEKRSRMIELLTLPAYARIQAMSEVEVQEYKNEKIAEIELKIREINLREAQAKTKREDFEIELQSLLRNVSFLSYDEKKAATDRIQYLQLELGTEYSDTPFSIFSQIIREREDTKKLIEQTRMKTTDDIKNELSSQIEKINWVKETMAMTPELGLDAWILNDPNIGPKLVKLFTDFKSISEGQRERVYSFDILESLNYLPDYLREKIKTSNYYVGYKKAINNPEKIGEIIEEFEHGFKNAKESFAENFTEDKLLNLVGKEKGVNSPEINISFLEKHSDKFEKSKLDHLLALDEQQQKLLVKLIKTKKTKNMIDELDEAIINELSSIYKEIIIWYKYENSKFLSIGERISFDSKNDVDNYLRRAKESIDYEEGNISRLKLEVEQVKKLLDYDNRRYKELKDEITQKIQALTGKPLDPEKMRLSTNYDQNKIDMASSASLIYKDEIVDKVQQEAQKQADMKEAELRNVTIEQLKKMREEVIASANLINNNQEEHSGGIKR